MPNLYETYIVNGPDLGCSTIDVSPSIYQELDEKFEGFKGRRLLAAHHFERDWPSWEIHPAGDEVVVLLSGSATFVLEEQAGPRTVRLEKAGEFVIVPRGTWHTARISEPTSMLFVTPGEGTRNRAA
jgi:mannose-6-phosphate isomerase-like protein (cupin superfamily)